MKIMPNRRRGFAAIAWLLVVFFIVFVIIIFGVAYTCIKTIQRIVPPPDKDQDGTVHMPGIGDKYQGGTVTGYAPPPHDAPQYLTDIATNGFTLHWVYIFASDQPRPSAWTNCIWNGDLSTVSNAFGSNGLPMEFWPAGQMPAARFYNIVLSNSFGQ